MTLLCLDAGNTRLKWGLHDGHAWRGQGAVSHADCERLADRLDTHPVRIVACNVAGAAVTRHIEALATQLGVPLEWFASSAAACGVQNGYDDPAQLGADRWAALIGARSLAAGPLLVVMAGTATTIDALDAAGLFRGGLILPGIDLMRTSLARRTAGLPEACGEFRAVPTNTDDAIVGGTLQATLGAIERQARRAFPAAPPVIVLSGGAADRIAAQLDGPVQRVEHLVLEGLARYAGH